MNKSRITKFMGICLCVTFLAGCVRNFSSTDREFHEASGQAQLSGTTITLMASGDWIKDAEMDLGSSFEAATGIQVIYELYPDDVYLDALFARLNGSNAPDIFLTQSGLAIKNTYKLDQYALDLSDEPWMAVYDNFSAEETSIDGRNYGMTYYDTTTDYYLIYNKKIFKKAGVSEVPSTYAEFLEACSRILMIGSTPMYEPMADGWHQTMLFAENGQIFEKLEPGVFERLNSNETTFAENPNMELALNQILKLAQNGYMGKNFATDTFDNAIDSLASGEYAMCMLKPGAITSIISSDMNKGLRQDDFGIMLLPVCDNNVLNIHPTGPSHFISRSSNNSEAAKLYLRYLAAQDSIQYMITRSNDVENLPFDANQTPKYNTTTSDFLGQFDEEHSGMVLQDEVTYFNEQWGEISADILKMCQGELSARQVLEEIDRRRRELAIAANDPAWKEE